MKSMDWWREKYKLNPGSLLPPRHDPPDADNLVRPSSCLLDLKAYFSNRKNATTASCQLARGGRLVQVTFFTAHPPRVSYLCVCCPGPGKSPHEQFACEPNVVATEADLVLIRMVFGPYKNTDNPRTYDFFVYRAGGGGRPPSLTRILPPKPFIFPQNCHVALLPRYEEEEPDLYYIVVLHKRTKLPDGQPELDFFSSRELQQMEPPSGWPHLDIYFDIYIYSSKTGSWTRKPTSLLQQHDDDLDLRAFRIDKAITIGGEGGAVAWVDLWRGFLLCDVLNGDSDPSFTTSSCRHSLRLDMNPTGIDRDVALIQGRIKVVDLQRKICPGTYGSESYIEGWTAATYSRAVTNPLEVGWLDGNCIKLDAKHVATNPMLLEHLPELRDNSGMPKPCLESLWLCCPVLSLHQDDLVYIIANAPNWDDKALGLAFDMTRGTIEEMVQVREERAIAAMLFSIAHSRISKYLDMDPGTRGKGKCRGKWKPAKDPLASSRAVPA